MFGTAVNMLLGFEYWLQSEFQPPYNPHLRRQQMMIPVLDPVAHVGRTQTEFLTSVMTGIWGVNHRTGGSLCFSAFQIKGTEEGEKGVEGGEGKGGKRKYFILAKKFY